MNTYLIGDVQGCFDSLQGLLQKINFNPEKDQLGFVGDLVNRGPKSLETLQFILSLKNPLVVLGNHDLHFLALYFLGVSRFHHIPHTLDAIFASHDCKKYIDFLIAQPFLHIQKNIVMVHAGIPPQWCIADAKDYADEASNILQKNPEAFFNNIYGNEPDAWKDDLKAWDRIRYIVNSFTRMRFCNASGLLDLKNKMDYSTNVLFSPWFSYRHFKDDAKDIYFGHWASLQGKCDHPHVFALDTGCAWGGQLTAVEIHSQQKYSIAAVEK